MTPRNPESGSLLLSRREAAVIQPGDGFMVLRESAVPYRQKTGSKCSASCKIPGTRTGLDLLGARQLEMDQVRATRSGRPRNGWCARTQRAQEHVIRNLSSAWF
jgi:hypothetical protein